MTVGKSQGVLKAGLLFKVVEGDQGDGVVVVGTVLVEGEGGG